MLGAAVVITVFAVTAENGRCSVGNELVPGKVSVVRAMLFNEGSTKFDTTFESEAVVVTAGVGGWS